MGLRERFNEEMKSAMKAKAQRRLSTTRMIMATAPIRCSPSLGAGRGTYRLEFNRQ